MINNNDLKKASENFYIKKNELYNEILISAKKKEKRLENIDLVNKDKLSKRKYFKISSVVAACLTLIVLCWFGGQYFFFKSSELTSGDIVKTESKSDIENKKLPLIPTLEHLNNGAMGDIEFDSSDIENYLQNNPLYELQNSTSLPVYKNTTCNTSDKRIEKVKEIANIIGVEIDTIEDHKDFSAVSCKAENTVIDISACGSCGIYFNYYNEENNNYNVNQDEELDYISIAESYFEKYNKLFNNFTPIYEISTQHENWIKIKIVNSSLSENNKILEQYLTVSMFIERYTGKLMWIDYFSGNYECLGQYSLKTEQEAIQALESGDFISCFLQKIDENYEILACDIRYLVMDSEEYIQPFYVFVIKGPEFSERKDDIYYFYVQAISEKYTK